ncbi:MAG: molybdopterin-dependent oxidoreductase [Proteobacteria bacterium]|nr:molybdopterin-dependent oxidoreductase [Pseudomonadota bacterium]
MLDRRHFLHGAGAVAATAAAGLPRSGWAAERPKLSDELPAGTREAAVLDALPGKQPLIKLSYRPPNYETPLNYFSSVITPNDAFFVRYHLADIPEVDIRTWKLKVGGAGASTPLELALAELRRFEQVEVTAVCQCSGNRRGLFNPHVAGVQWGVGAMGNARWKGVRLKDVLAKAGVRKETVEVVLDGADGPVIDKTPDFVKSIPIWKALDDTVLIALEMNGQPLPSWNGFPARLVVPGWTGTYWMKHLTSIELAQKPYDGFWMKSAYRIPKGKFALVDRFLSQETEVNTPITEMVVNSLITGPAPGQRIAARQPVAVTGIAWDGGYGIQSVEVSADNGATWQPATLGDDPGRFSFRAFSARLNFAKPGAQTILAKATNRLGASQPRELIQNPAGYHHNLVARVAVTVA